MKNKYKYKTGAILLPFIVLLFVELVLRICGYGYNTNLFIEDETGSYYQLNPDISKKYFTIQENATIGNHEYFSKKKSFDTKRFFVLGASSAIGYPYMHNGSFARMLKYRLQFIYPHVNIEIINLSLTAVNTYTLYDFSKQLVDYAPDAILVYAGHNEYYGALGAASTSSTGLSPTWIRLSLALKESRVIQGVFRLASAIKGVDKQLTDYDRTLMERMTAEQSIPYQSALFKQGIAQFDHNTGDMLSLFNKRRIPVFIGTLAYNQRHQKPFVSSTGSLSADQQYERGNAAYTRGDYIAAKEHYTRAKEYDELRFRAPEEMNTRIRQYARDLEYVHLVDVFQAFEDHSPHGVLDSTLLLEHVHPNLDGQRIMAEAFYEVITRAGILPGASGEMPAAAIDYPVLTHDTLFGNLAISRLKTQWPFNEPAPADPIKAKNYEEQIALARLNNQITWYEALRRLHTYYVQKDDKARVLQILESLYLEYPSDVEYAERAASLSLLTGQAEKARFYQMKSR
jgi:tetratricopeptide (TPR) repeat protein